MTPHTKIKIGQVLRYPFPHDPVPEFIDGFRNYFNLSELPGNKRLIMNRGIDNPARVAAPDGSRLPVLLIRSNPIKSGTAETPWRDIFDPCGEGLRYYGDHRADIQGPLGVTRGNKNLVEVAKAHLSGKVSDRATSTPLLVFKSVERNGNQKGYVEFCGLGVVESYREMVQTDPKSGQGFPNYVFDIRFLDLGEGRELDWAWINSRRDRAFSLDETLNYAPASWRSWVKGVIEMRPPNWTWDELLLACALTCRNGWREVKKSDPRAVKLSELLQLLPIHPSGVRGEKFRNADSVQRKTADLATAHRDYVGSTTKGGRLTKEMVEAFTEREEEMLSAADSLRSLLEQALEEGSVPDYLKGQEAGEEDRVAREGRLLERVHRFRERSQGLREAKIKEVIKTGKSVSCEACGFDFGDIYGVHGANYIEVHHVTPLHESGEAQVGLDSLVLLCANCHRMSHRRLDSTRTWPTLAELRALIQD